MSHPAPMPPNEAGRLEALRSAHLLDSRREKIFDDLARLASRILACPIAIVSLVGDDRQWFKACVGISSGGSPRDIAFCGHAILSDRPLVVPDTHLDARFRDNPLVTSSPFIRFYAGMPLITADHFALGTICVIDTVPRELSVDQIDTLTMLGRIAATIIDQRRIISTAA